MLYKDKLSGAFLVAGWDPYKGPQVYNIMLGGAAIESKVVFAGSGSGFMMGFIDESFREGMTFQEAKHFGVTAVKQAIARDASSGGSIRLVTLGPQGIHREYISNPTLSLK
jgi:20S proteasome subunit beta 1